MYRDEFYRQLGGKLTPIQLLNPEFCIKDSKPCRFIKDVSLRSDKITIVCERKDCDNMTQGGRGKNPNSYFWEP